MSQIKKIRTEKDLENIKCNICGATDSTLYTKNSGFNLVKCSKCGLIYANPQPTLNYLINFYSTGDMTEDSWDRKTRYDKLMADSNRERVDYLFSKFPNRKVKFLDIGTGLKQFEYVKQKGGSVLGTELSKTFVSYAKKQGWNVRFGDALRMKLKSKAFDVITMMAVVEHLKDPKAYLLECKRILKDDGIIVVKVPNLHYIYQNATKLPMSQVMHLFYFTPQTIRQLFEECGYKVMRIEPTLDGGSDNIIKNILMIAWDKVAKFIYNTTGIHTNLQLTVYAKKLKKEDFASKQK